MNVLSLCSGLEGLGLGLKRAWPEARTICYVEINPFCQAILLARMADGVLDRAPLWDDLRTFDGIAWRGVVDCVAAGFPCQPFSTAGKRKGDADARNLWPDVRRIISESEPAVVVLENVPGALPYFYHVVLPELSGLGYTASAGLVTAAEVGAPHRRQRLFVVADCRGTGRPKDPGSASGDEEKDGRSGWDQCESHGDHEPERQGAGLGHAVSARRTSARVGSEQYARAEPEERGGGNPVGHAHEPGLEIRQPRGDGDSIPPWPPGPTERDRWAAVLAQWPELAPALADTEDRRSRDTRRGEGPRGAAEGAAPESPLRRVAARLPSRVDRLRALGNAAVPAQVERAIRLLMDYDG